MTFCWTKVAVLLISAICISKKNLLSMLHRPMFEAAAGKTQNTKRDAADIGNCNQEDCAAVSGSCASQCDDDLMIIWGLLVST